MITLETDRLILRPWRGEDLEDLYEYAKDPQVGPNAGWEPHADRGVSEAVISMFIDKGEVWAIALKATGKVIGSVGLHEDRKRSEDPAIRMLGYVLSRDYWGRGLMTEAARRVVRFAFDEIGLELLSVYHYPHNARSRRVIEKCGFQYEGTLRRAGRLYDGTVLDEVCYSITSKEYAENR